MSVKELITVPDDILRKKSEPLNKVDVNEKKLIKDLFETMYHHNGIGLAAVQVGILKRVVVLDVSKNENEKKPLCFINPQIKSLSKKYEDILINIYKCYDKLVNKKILNKKELPLLKKWLIDINKIYSNLNKI